MCRVPLTSATMRSSQNRASRKCSLSGALSVTGNCPIARRARSHTSLAVRTRLMLYPLELVVAHRAGIEVLKPCVGAVFLFALGLLALEGGVMGHDELNH